MLKMTKNYKELQWPLDIKVFTNANILVVGAEICSEFHTRGLSHRYTVFTVSESFPMRLPFTLNLNL